MMSKIQLRITPSFAGLLGQNDYNWYIVDKEVQPQTKLGDVLKGLAGGHPGFGRILFDPHTGKLNQEIMITLNDRLLQGSNAADVVPSDGDIVILTPAYEGG